MKGTWLILGTCCFCLYAIACEPTKSNETPTIEWVVGESITVTEPVTEPAPRPERKSTLEAVFADASTAPEPPKETSTAREARQQPEPFFERHTESRSEPPVPEVPMGPRCGDGLCNGGETTTSCPKDCQSPIWVPTPGTTWQWQLSGKLDTSLKVQMYDIDLFDHSASVIAGLKAKGIKVICYFSAGSYEDWRPDESLFPSQAKGKKMDGWNELWLDIRNQTVWSIMQKRLDLAKQKGCDGVEPDNVDGYQNSTGFPLKGGDQLAYNKMLATEAHKRGLSIGLKNDLDQVKDLVNHFDWALNEECVKYNECSMLTPFIQAGKAVFHVDYKPMSLSKMCTVTKPLQLSTLRKNLNLDAWRETCP